MVHSFASIPNSPLQVARSGALDTFSIGKCRTRFRMINLIKALVLAVWGGALFVKFPLASTDKDLFSTRFPQCGSHFSDCGVARDCTINGTRSRLTEVMLHIRCTCHL